MKIRSKYICLFTICIFLISYAYSAIYKYEDDEGKVIYSNVPLKGMKAAKFLPPELSVYSSPMKSKNNNISIAPKSNSNRKVEGGSKLPGTTSENNIYAKVDPGVQQTRDQKRRGILQQELNNELKALADAKQALADAFVAKKSQDAIKRLQDNVVDREKNVQALRRELGQG